MAESNKIEFGFMRVKEIPMEIKVLGPGCAKCYKTEKIVMDALAEAGVAANVEKVSDMMKIAGYGVFGTPAVVVDGEVKCVGKVPGKKEVLSWILK
jgi:small redox-active disulfide protein 2